MSMLVASGLGGNSPERQLVECLLDPCAYPEPTESVESIETHISWVFLTDRFAYKLKKPVRFEFLDFSTPELRRAACEEEVSLNQRLAMGVYLDVVPIVSSSSGRVEMGGTGEPVDWAVKMKRLPAEAALDVLIRNHEPLLRPMNELAETLAVFYQNLPPTMIHVDDYRSGLEQHVSANRDDLVAALPASEHLRVQRADAAQWRLLKLAPDLLDERVRNGRIVEGHGDLRPEHIYLSPTPVIIDCLEFSRELRTLDVADELAFLAMECDLLGAPGCCETVMQRYAEMNSDYPPRLLMDFYQLYRACVRTKVCALRAGQLSGFAQTEWLDRAHRYLDLADRYVPRLGPPVVMVVGGLSGTGKSTLAESISQELAIDLLQTDAVRQQVAAPSGQQDGFNEGRYRPTQRAAVYDEMHIRGERLLRDGLSVILDGTYLEADQRAAASRLAKRQHATFLSIRCDCPREIALERISARAATGNIASEVRVEFFDRQRAALESDPPGVSSLTVDTSSSIVEPRERIFRALRRECFDNKSGA